MQYEARTEVVFLRLRPTERERAAKLAAAEEVRIPELVRQLLRQAWQKATPKDGSDEAA